VIARVLSKRDRRLKSATLEAFVSHETLRPGEYSEIVGFYPVRAAYTYLKRLRRRGYLLLRRDWKGRLLYKISGKGARWLLWWKRQIAEGKVR
jgi:predicted transcriptional regulator